MFDAVLRNWRRAVEIEGLGQLSAKPDAAARQLGFVPHNWLPGWIEDQVSGVTEQLYPVTTGLEHVEKVRLASAVFRRSGLNWDVVVAKEISRIHQVLRVTVPVTHMVKATSGTGGIPHKSNLVHQRTHAQPGSHFGPVVQYLAFAQPETK